MHFGPEILTSEGMLAVEITENDRQQCPSHVPLGSPMSDWAFVPWIILASFLSF